MIVRALRLLLVVAFAAWGTSGVAFAAFSKSVEVSTTTITTAASFPPVLRSVPDIEGSAVQGTVLTVNDADWEGGLPPTSSSYQWLRCDSAGANCLPVQTTTTPSSYTVASLDVMNYLKLRVVATRGSAAPVTTESVLSTQVKATGALIAGNIAPYTTAKPTISGTMAVNQTITANDGTWTNASPGGFSYQWQRCSSAGDACTNVGTGLPAYTLVAADAGKRMRLRVTATNNGFGGGGTQATAIVADTSLVDP